MTNKEADAVRNIIKNTGGYDNLIKGFPRYGIALDALPDETWLNRCNIILREITKDALLRARSGEGD